MDGNKHVVGGGAIHRPKKNSRPVKTFKQKKRNVLVRARNVVGERRIKSLQHNWKEMNDNVKSHGYRGDGNVGDGILICLQK